MPYLGLGNIINNVGGQMGSGPSDPDVNNYFNAVAASGSSITQNNRTAISAFVSQLKTGGVWSSIKQANLLCGANTLAGALVPLIGNTVSNYNGNFGDAQYNRLTGILGSNVPSVSRAISTNRTNNVDGSTNRHLYVCVTNLPTLPVPASEYLIGSDNISSAAARIWFPTGTRNVSMSLNSTSATTWTDPVLSTINGFGIARDTTSTNVESMINGSFLTSGANNAVTPSTGTINVFCAGSAHSSPSSARIAFYSIGTYANTAVIDAAVKNLINVLT